jgi:hypothetical protein
MSEVSPEELTIESQHGGIATFVQSVPVREPFEGKPAWDGTGCEGGYGSGETP